MNKTVLIAHYNKNLDWVSNISNDFQISVYSTSDKTKNFVTNKGMDSIMYIKYIIDNYNTMSTKTIFCHHHEFDWTQDYSLHFIINNLKIDCDDYFSICARANYSNVFVVAPETRKILKENWYIFEKYIEYPDQLFYYAGTQFCVDKRLILSYPLEYWEFLYNWILDSDLPDALVGRIFEWCWHYLLTKIPIEKQRDIKEIIDFGDKWK
jgi:hypothetical protein